MWFHHLYVFRRDGEQDHGVFSLPLSFFFLPISSLLPFKSQHPPFSCFLLSVRRHLICLKHLTPKRHLEMATNNIARGGTLLQAPKGCREGTANQGTGAGSLQHPGGDHNPSHGRNHMPCPCRSHVMHPVVSQHLHPSPQLTISQHLHPPSPQLMISSTDSTRLFFSWFLPAAHQASNRPRVPLLKLSPAPEDRSNVKDMASVAQKALQKLRRSRFCASEPHALNHWARSPPRRASIHGRTRAGGPTKAHHQTGQGSRHLSRSFFCLMLSTIRTTHQMSRYKEGWDTERKRRRRRRRRKKARQPAMPGENMTLETANSLDKSRGHLTGMQKSAKATRNGQSKVPLPQKKNPKTGDFEEEGSPTHSH